MGRNFRCKGDQKWLTELITATPERVVVIGQCRPHTRTWNGARWFTVAVLETSLFG